MTDATCSIFECGNSVHLRTWCLKHYSRWQKRRDPLRAQVSRTLADVEPAEYVWSHFVRVPSGCWEWAGGVSDTGYATVRHRGVAVLAHRFTYELLVGPIADGLEIDHLCFNRRCINPSHLEAVTPRVNKLRSTSVSAVNATKTHCNNGHPFDEANTHVDRLGRRRCRACARAKERRRREARWKAEAIDHRPPTGWLEPLPTEENP